MPALSTPKLKRNILYYPTINIPSTDWLKNAVLYWDEVSSIVPRDWEKDKSIKISTDIELLMDKGIFRPIHPDELLENTSASQMVENMTDEFISIFESSHFKELLRKKRLSYSRVHALKFSKTRISGKGLRLHIDKTNYEIADFLKKEKLAMKDHAYDQWYRVDSTTALLYMSLLAKYIASNDKEHTVIGTDLRVYEKLNFQQSRYGEGISVINCNFKGLIPSPASHTEMKAILKFKRARKSNIIAFRRFLLDIQSRLSQAGSNAEVKDILASGQEDLLKGLSDLKAVFKESKIDMVVKSLKSIVNVQSSTAITGGAMLLNEKYQIAGLPDWLKVAAIATAGVIDISSGIIERYNMRNEYERNSPFAYLYQAQRAGLVKI